MTSAGSRLDVLTALAAFALALFASIFFAGGRYGVNPDGALELHIARNIVAGDGIVEKIVREDAASVEPSPSITKPPLYMLAIAGLAKLGLSPKIAGWGISQASFAFAAALLFGLARLVLPAWPAFAVACLFSLQVQGLQWSIYLHEDTLFLAFVMAALFQLGYLRERPQAKRVSWFVLGVVTACAVLTRYVGIALLAAIAFTLVLDLVKRRIDRTRVALFGIGVAAASAIPFVRFVMLWSAGTRPGFFEGTGTTWFRITAGWISTLQRDFFGTLLVWLYNESIKDWLVIVAALAFLAWMLYLVARSKAFFGVALFIVFYMVIVTREVARVGTPSFEPRYALPVEGLMILMAVAVIWHMAHGRGRRIRALAGVIGAVSISAFLFGQSLRYHEFDSLGKGDESRDYCPAPETIAWIKANIAPGEVVMSTQCGYQLLAESHQYFWLPIPPADEYVSAPRFLARWGESDFLSVKQKLGAKWIVLLGGADRDPFIKSPGYGAFVYDLFAGKETARIAKVAQLKDGVAYVVR